MSTPRPSLPDAPCATAHEAPALDVRRFPVDGILAFAPTVFRDARGGFLEAYQRSRYTAAGVPAEFVQDNVAWSEPGVLRGLHLQHPHAQGKLVSVLRGAIFDVAADVRVGSPTFGRHVAFTLEAGGWSQLWVPPGFAHGYLATDGDPIVAYKCTDVYRPDCELVLGWDDPDLDIRWPSTPRALSAKDRAGVTLAEAARRGLLPPYEPPFGDPTG